MPERSCKAAGADKGSRAGTDTSRIISRTSRMTTGEGAAAGADEGSNKGSGEGATPSLCGATAGKAGDCAGSGFGLLNMGLSSCCIFWSIALFKPERFSVIHVQ